MIIAPENETKPGQKRTKPTETENGKPVWGRNAQGRPICASPKASGNHCASTAVMSNGRCSVHGGKTPAGADHPSYKGDRGSVILKMLPKHLQKAAEASLASDDQIDLSPEIALLDANTYRLLEQLKSHGDRNMFEMLGDRMARLEALTSEKNDDFDPWEVRREYEALAKIVANGHNQEVVWEQMQQNAEARRRLTETDQKRRFSLSKVLEAKHVDTLILAILTIIRNKVPEAKVRAAIGREVLSLVMPREAAAVTVVEDELESRDENPTETPLLEAGTEAAEG